MFEKLFNKCKNKEEQFTELYNKNFKYIYSFIYPRIGGNSLAAEEILQETFTAAWISYEKFSNKSSYTTWLCAIARNKLYDYYRKKTISDKDMVKEDDISPEVPSGFDLEKVVLDNEMAGIVAFILENINPVYRYSLIMKYIDEYNVKEIAKVLGRTPKAVDGILQRAKNSFMKEYYRVMERKNVDE